MNEDNRLPVPANGNPGKAAGVVHPAWLAFIRFCTDMQYGEVERLSIQDGLPVLAETTKKKTKFLAG